MSEPLHLVCPKCDATNRIPAARLTQAPKCGKCHMPLFAGQPQAVTAASFRKHIERDEIPVLVDFWAPWCGPCKMVAPVLEKLSRDFAGDLKVVKVNVDESPSTAQRYSASSIPMLLFVRDGELIDRVVGAQPEHVLRSAIEALL